MPLIQPADCIAWCKQSDAPLVFAANGSLPNTDPRAIFAAKHLPSAQYFDVTTFYDPRSPLPNTLLPNLKTAEDYLSALGLANDQPVILYDSSPVPSAFRAYWILRVFGHPAEKLFILDGGLRAYEKIGGKTVCTPTVVIPTTYEAIFKPKLLRTLNQMKQAIKDPKTQIIDTRHAVRFTGGPESRPGLRAGHIPGSFCFPFTCFFAEDGTFLPIDKISKQLREIGVDLASPIISTCGSGVTACVLNFFLDQLHHPTHALYDGSWSEWGAMSCFPGEESLSERPVTNCILV